MVHAFKADISPILDAVLTPLLQRVFERLSETPNGTDDELQLRDLRHEFLNFVLVVLNNDLASILISPSMWPQTLSEVAHANN